MGWDGLNRRQFPRIVYPCLIKISDIQNHQDLFLTHTENIGLGGICVTLKSSVKKFTPMELEIDLLDAGEHIRCSGKVVWVVHRKSTETYKPLFYDVGIEFQDITPADTQRLDEAIKRFVQRSIKTERNA